MKLFLSSSFQRTWVDQSQCKWTHNTNTKPQTPPGIPALSSALLLAPWCFSNISTDPVPLLPLPISFALLLRPFTIRLLPPLPTPSHLLTRFALLSNPQLTNATSVAKELLDPCNRVTLITSHTQPSSPAPTCVPTPLPDPSLIFFRCIFFLCKSSFYKLRVPLLVRSL